MTCKHQKLANVPHVLTEIQKKRRAPKILLNESKTVKRVYWSDVSHHSIEAADAVKAEACSL